jgi:hypothetical protein
MSLIKAESFKYLPTRQFQVWFFGIASLAPSLKYFVENRFFLATPRLVSEKYTLWSNECLANIPDELTTSFQGMYAQSQLYYPVGIAITFPAISPKSYVGNRYQIGLIGLPIGDHFYLVRWLPSRIGFPQHQTFPEVNEAASKRFIASL